jgi:hypothetical protein
VLYLMSIQVIMYVVCCWLQALYCTQHAAQVPDTVLKEYRAKKVCTDAACSTTATFGHRGGDAIYCKSRIPKDLRHVMVDVLSHSCEIEDCNIQPAYGYASDRVSVHHVTVHYI